jgi:Zn-dependent peptidase ImmA (M78 family)/DNA-binding XRE family transcriptional regulator
MAGVAPRILIWARETAGLSQEEAAKKLGISVKRLASFEDGEREPTRQQIAAMAKRYHRPLLVFYLANPPSEGDQPRDFRSLPDRPPAGSEALVSALLRDVLARQRVIKAALEELEENEIIPAVGSVRIAGGIERATVALEEFLGTNRDEFRAQQSVDAAFSMLRSRAEKAGVFVLLMGNLGTHHTDIDVHVFRGFALADDIAPFVVINEKDSRAAWSFTLLHELVHVLLGESGISGYDGRDDVERFCDSVAARFLLLPTELAQIQLGDRPNIQTLIDRISAFANARKLSRKMIAYNLLRSNAISARLYQDLSAKFDAERVQRKQEDDREGGPSYYVVRRHRLGSGLINTVDRLISGGALTTPKAGLVLGVKPTNVYPLIAHGKAA